MHHIRPGGEGTHPDSLCSLFNTTEGPDSGQIYHVLLDRFPDACRIEVGTTSQGDTGFPAEDAQSFFGGCRTVIGKH